MGGDRGVEVDRLCLNRITLENKLAANAYKYNAHAENYPENFWQAAKATSEWLCSEMKFMETSVGQLWTTEELEVMGKEDGGGVDE